MILQAYKRGVYRPPPSQFVIEMLGAAKQGMDNKILCPSKPTIRFLGGSYSFGMRIHPILTGDKQSMSSRRSYTEYDIWRRWEDCLLFQSSLEIEYRQRARDKRQRLARGKGVKRNGFYLQDQASSWESLPPGPDPNSVAREVTDCLPSLTKKATVFRATQATIDQRAAELKAFVEALFKDDVPALIDDLRRERIVLDFFGYWRRDYELAEKERKQKHGSSKSRTSITSSIFSTYFSSSNSTTKSPNYPDSVASSGFSPSRCTVRGRSPAMTESRRTRKDSSDSSAGSVVPRHRRAYSTGSSGDPSSTPSDGSLESPVHVATTIPDIVEDTVPIAFNHDPYSRPNLYDENPMSVLGILPEDREVSHKDVPPTPTPPRRRGRNSGFNPDRHGVIFLTPPLAAIKQLSIDDSANSRELRTLLPLSRTDGKILGNRNDRQSWQTVDSAAYVLEGLHLDLPAPPTDFSHRASISSIASFQTNCSVEGVLPRSPFDDGSPRPRPQTRTRGRSRVVSCPVSISEFDEEWSDPDNDILDGFLAGKSTRSALAYGADHSFTESFSVPGFDVPQEIIIEDHPGTSPYLTDDQSTLSIPFFPSPTKSTTSSSCNSSAPQQFTIKAGYDDTIILLRVPCEISYKDLRYRLYNKFVGLEGIPLSDNFAISFVRPITADNTLNHSQSHHSDSSTLYPVASEGDWECVAASLVGSKLTLRISDPIS